MVSKYDKIFKVAMKAVYKAGALVNSRNDGRQPYEIKDNVTDLVTPTDTDVEKMIIDKLSEKFPSHKFISEEMEPCGLNKPLTNDPTWLMDPVDGTMNFVHSYPQSCISLALFVDKVPVIGIIYNAVLNQKFTAIQGKGAFNNDCKMCVSNTKELDKALIMAELGTRDKDKLKIVNKNFKTLSNRVHGIRCTGSAALNIAMVASGAADAYYEMGMHHWDVAAGLLLIEEAGGVVISPDGDSYDLFSRRMLCASTMELACELGECLAQYYPEDKDE